MKWFCMDDEQIQILKGWFDSTLHETLRLSDREPAFVLDRVEKIQSMRKKIEHAFNIDLKAGKRNTNVKVTKQETGYNS